MEKHIVAETIDVFFFSEGANKQNIIKYQGNKQGNDPVALHDRFLVCFSLSVLLDFTS